MVHELLLYLAVILLSGFMIGKLADLLKIPEITGYIVAGVILGPSVLNIVSVDVSTDLKVIMNIALGIIAYTLGTELWIPKLKRTGKQIIIIMIFESLTTALIVLVVLLLFKTPLWLALILSAISAASAPAGPMAIVRRLKAKGPVTDVAIPVIGLDDITAVLLFGLFSSVALNIVTTGESRFTFTMLTTPLMEVGIAILIGSILGAVLGFISKYVFMKFQKRDRYLAYLSIALAFILLILWFSTYAELTWKLHISTLLTPLMMGMMFTNIISKEEFDIQMAAFSNFTGPLTILLFTIAGSELSLKALFTSGIIAFLYIIFRSIGKYSGAYLGASISKSTKIVKQNVGLCILTQGGVEIGMVIAVVAMFKEHTKEAMMVQSIVLAGILVFELIGPVLFRHTIVRVGEDTINRTNLSI